MRKRSPINLVECSLNHLVHLTISTLQRFESNNNLKEPLLEDEFIHDKLGLKRKFDAAKDYKNNQIPRKKIRRKSHDFTEAEFRNNITYKETGSKDDWFVKKCSLVDVVIILRNYFKYLPQNLWNIFFYSVLKSLNNLGATSNIEFKALELLFSKNVSSFSTKLISRDVFDKCESLICEKIHLCKQLKFLYIHYNLHSNCVDILFPSLNKLNNLRSIILLPESKQSYHMAISIIANHCIYLEELAIVYDNELLSEIGNISCLTATQKLRSLTLCSYGKGSETAFIEQLLYSLKDLIYFFHRELPHALIDISQKRYQEHYNFKLRILFLAKYCKCVGSQLCYLPDESLSRIGPICPYISSLKIVKPTNMSKIVESFPSLKKVQIHDCNIIESFITSFERKSLNCLLSLSISNNEYINYECILLISNCCPQLKEFEIVHSNLFSSNDLKFTKNAFSQLTKLKLQKFPFEEQPEPRFVFPRTMVINGPLFKYLLSGAKLLEQLYLDFDTESEQEVATTLIPKEDDLMTYISSCKELKDLMLLSCPNVTYKMLNVIVHSCPKLQHLWDIDLWKIPPKEMDKIVRYYSHLFFQSYERQVR